MGKEEQLIEEFAASLAGHDPKTIRTYLSNLNGTDQLLDTFSLLFTDLLRRGRNAQKHHLYRSVTELNRALNTFTSIAEAFLHAREHNEDPVAAILTVVDEPTLQDTVKIAKNYMRPPSMDYRDLLENRYRYRRRKSLLEIYSRIAGKSKKRANPVYNRLHAQLIESGGSP